MFLDDSGHKGLVDFATFDTDYYQFSFFKLFFGSATALKPHGCAAQAAAGSSVQSHLGSGLACTLPSPGTCGLLTLSCSEQRICACYLSQSATICSFSVFFCQAFRQQPLRVSMPHLGVVHVFAPVELPCIILLHLVL